MRGCWYIATLATMVFAAAQSVGQQGAPSANGKDGKDAKSEPAKVGNYSLVVTTLEPTTQTHWLNPPPTINVKPGTKLAPAGTSGNLTVPQQYAIEAFGTPQQECEESAPQHRDCAARDRTELTIRDPNTVAYRILTRGGAVQLRVNLQVHDLLPVSHTGASTDWHTGDVIFVSVAKATPAYRFVSETLVGLWNGEPVVFEAGKALPASAQKGLQDLVVHQDLGDAVLYSYRVK